VKVQIPEPKVGAYVLECSYRVATSHSRRYTPQADYQVGLLYHQAPWYPCDEYDGSLKFWVVMQRRVGWRKWEQCGLFGPYLTRPDAMKIYNEQASLIVRCS
jgi:hypothetical protein